MNATAVMIGGRTQVRPANRIEAVDAACVGDGPQHMQALQRANKVRLARAELKRRIASGELSAAEIVRTPPEEVLTMEVAELLMSQRRWGHTRARRFLAGIPMAETKTLGSMTLRQRDTLAHTLAALAPRSTRQVEHRVSQAA
jgi:hypothetical protein